MMSESIPNDRTEVLETTGATSFLVESRWKENRILGTGANGSCFAADLTNAGLDVCSSTSGLLT